MNKHLFHEEIGGGYAIGPKVIIDTAEINPGEFETIAFNSVTGEELDVAVAHSAQDAERDFRAMVQRHANPLQAAFYKAGLVPGERYTLVYLGEFGFPTSLRMTFDGAKLGTYAQYADAVYLDYTPYRSRRGRRMFLYNRSFLLYAGWRDLSANATYNRKDRGDGVITSISKYGCFDERFMEDIKAMWPDYIVSYEHDRVYRRSEKAVDPISANGRAEEARKPFTLLPGVTVVFDAEGVYGPCIDIRADEFERLFAPTDEDDVGAEERLARALKRAAIASASYINERDGGTCNFDSPALDFAAYGMSKAEAESAINAAGLRCHDWKPFGEAESAPTYLVISGFQSGQGDRHTKMAEAFCNSMNADGFDSMMYYRMD